MTKKDFEEYQQYLKEHPCKDCEAWDGSDCSRDPYADGCIDPVVEAFWARYEAEGVDGIK